MPNGFVPMLHFCLSDWLDWRLWNEHVRENLFWEKQEKGRPWIPFHLTDSGLFICWVHSGSPYNFNLFEMHVKQTDRERDIARVSLWFDLVSDFTAENGELLGGTSRDVKLRRGNNQCTGFLEPKQKSYGAWAEARLEFYLARWPDLIISRNRRKMHHFHESRSVK